MPCKKHAAQQQRDSPSCVVRHITSKLHMWSTAAACSKQLTNAILAVDIIALLAWQCFGTKNAVEHFIGMCYGHSLASMPVYNPKCSTQPMSCVKHLSKTQADEFCTAAETWQWLWGLQLKQGRLPWRNAICYKRWLMGCLAAQSQHEYAAEAVKLGLSVWSEL